MYKTNKNKYFEWLFDKKSQVYAENIKLTLEELFKNKDIDSKNIKLKIEENKYSKKYCNISVRSFINYCDELELIEKDIVEEIKKKIKINFKSNIDSYVPSKNEIIKSINNINTNYPQFEILYKLMIESGCRFTELKELILKFKKENIETHEEIITYKNFYLRGKKSSFYVFFRNKTYMELIKIINNINIETLNSFQNILSHRKEYISLKYLRKYNFTLMIENDINLEIANFIQGRTSQNIGFNHYLAKKQYAIKEYKKILEKLTHLD